MMLLNRKVGYISYTDEFDNTQVMYVTEKQLADLEQQIKNTKPFKDTILSIGWYALCYMIGVYVGSSL